MANVEHENIADANLHQPKGIAAATAGAIVVADGAGSSDTTDNSSTPVNLYDNVLSRAEMKDYSEALNALGIVTTATAVDLTLGNAVTVTMNANITFSFTNPPATGRQGSFTMIVTQDDTTGSRVATWPAAVQWAGGSAPTLSTATDAIDILGFITVDAGTTWYGFNGGINFS